MSQNIFNANPCRDRFGTHFAFELATYFYHTRRIDAVYIVVQWLKGRLTLFRQPIHLVRLSEYVFVYYEREIMPCERHMPQNRFSPAPVPTECLKRQLPFLSRLVENANTGMFPNCIELMSAISEIVAFNTKCDSSNNQLIADDMIMSQNSCRFCS